MRFAVIGAGAVGGYFGGRLALADEDVTFVVRGHSLEALRKNGLNVESINGDFAVPRVRAVAEMEHLNPFDVILTCVKAWQIPNLGPQLKSLINYQTVVIPLQNGVEAVEQLSAEIGKAHVVGGLCHILSSQIAPGKIKHHGMEPSMTLGELDHAKSPRLELIREHLEKAGIKVHLAPDIQQAIWRKFLFIAPLSGLAAVTRVPVGVIRCMPETRKMLENAMFEVVRVAHAAGVILPDSAIEDTLKYVDAMPDGGTTSMQRDIMEGRPSELTELTGAIVRLGAQHYVDTPVNGYFYHTLLPQEMKVRANGD